MSVVTYPQAEQQFTWYQLSWDQYESLLRTFGDRRLRHTYVEGTLEIVSPSMDHESSKSLLGGFVKMLCRLQRLPRRSIGSTTMKKRQWRRGLEPDEGFYVGEESVRKVSSRREFDPDRDPPPDLIIEVDTTSSSEDRIEFYRRLRVREVWRYANGNVRIYGLAQNNRYRPLKRSRLFPVLTSDDLTRFLALRDNLDDTAVDLRFERWVQRQLASNKGSDD
jgi:Uma2 family endonuclease